MSLVNDLDHLRQAILFDGLERPTSRGALVYPTDVDLLLDAFGLGWFIGEVKMVGSHFPLGQKIALNRLHEALMTTAPTLSIVAYHTVKAPESIIVAHLPVEMRRLNGGEWEMLFGPGVDTPTVMELYDQFIEEVRRAA